MPTVNELNEKAIAAIRERMNKLNTWVAHDKSQPIPVSRLRAIRMKIEALQQELAVRIWLNDINQHQA